MAEQRTNICKIVAVVLTYWSISISMVFANKYLVGTKDSQHDLSIFVAWVQCCVCVVFVLSGLRGYAMLNPSYTAPVISPAICTARSMVILTTLFVGMLSFNNLCLKFVGVAFYQVARSLTLIFTAFFTTVILKQKVSWKSIVCCLMVAAGFFLGVDQEKLTGSFSFSGVLFGVTTSIFVALVGIYTKKNFDLVENSSIKMTLYMNLNSVVLFIPVVIASEQAYNVFTSDIAKDAYFWLFLICTGVMSCLINWISSVQIQVTSPVTHHISANTKAVIQTIMAIVYYGEYKKPLWWFSNFLVIAGAFSYAMVKYFEERTNVEKPETKGVDVEEGHVKKGDIINSTKLNGGKHII